jgi:hypothetical protein
VSVIEVYRERIYEDRRTANLHEDRRTSRLKAHETRDHETEDSKTRRPFEELEDRKASKPKDRKARRLEDFLEGLEVRRAWRLKAELGD